MLGDLGFFALRPFLEQLHKRTETRHPGRREADELKPRSVIGNLEDTAAHESLSFGFGEALQRHVVPLPKYTILSCEHENAVLCDHKPFLTQGPIRTQIRLQAQAHGFAKMNC